MELPDDFTEAIKMKDVYSANKMLRHLDRIDSFLEDGLARPVELMIDLTNKCNYNCGHCLMQYRSIEDWEAELDLRATVKFLAECYAGGLRAVKITGGEPTIHPKFVDIMGHIRSRFEFGLVTNGSMLHLGEIQEAIHGAKWIRVSVDAAEPIMYVSVHGVSNGKTRMDRIEEAIKRIRKASSSTVIGYSFVVTNENYVQIEDAAVKAMEWGCDNIRYTGHLSPWGLQIDQEMVPLVLAKLDRAKELECKDFSVFTFKERQTQNTMRPEICYYSMLVSVIAANGDAYLCCEMKNIPRGKIGNIYELTFEQLCMDRAPVRIKEFCVPCWMDAKNRLVDGVYEPQIHENFV